MYSENLEARILISSINSPILIEQVCGLNLGIVLIITAGNVVSSKNWEVLAILQAYYIIG
jgi:hypothetical protein